MTDAVVTGVLILAVIYCALEVYLTVRGQKRDAFRMHELEADNARLREIVREVRREAAEVPGASCPSYVTLQMNPETWEKLTALAGTEDTDD